MTSVYRAMRFYTTSVDPRHLRTPQFGQLPTFSLSSQFPRKRPFNGANDRQETPHLRTPKGSLNVHANRATRSVATREPNSDYAVRRSGSACGWASFVMAPAYSRPLAL